MPGEKINLVNAHGEAISVSADEAAGLLESGQWHPETGADVADRAVSNVREDIYGGTANAAIATGVSALDSATGGGLGAALRVTGAGDSLRKLKEQHKTASTVGSVAGAFLPGGISGIATRAGEKVGGLIGGTSGLASIGRAAAVTSAEGLVYGTGAGVEQLTMSEDPITIERAASVIGSNALFGAATGGAIGAAGKLVEKGLGAAKSKLDDIATKGMESDVAKTQGRAALADDIKALRSEMKENKIWLATKDADVKAIKEVREVGKIALDADRMIDRTLRNPKALAQKPERVLTALQQQEHALETLIGQADNLRPIFAKDATGARQAAFDYASTALQKNRALQEKIGAITAKPAAAATPGLGQVIGDAGLGYAVGAAAGIPILGQGIAAVRIGGAVIKKLGLNTTAAAARGSKAIETFLDVSRKVAPRARLAATKTLTSVAYGAAAPAAKTLPEAYRARSSEIRELTAPGPDGKPVMRMDARQAMADRLAPIRAAQPLLADKIETTKARGVEYLARTQPKMPDLPGMDPKRWQPSDMQMREWARRVAAVEDPHGVIERLASGEVTPEDAEVMREVYPEMYAQIQQQIMMQMGELQAKLPFQRRIALSIFSGVPTDPTLDPRVLSVLQAGYAAEAGTEGGVQAPVAQPAFGSVSKEKPTAAQER